MPTIPKNKYSVIVSRGERHEIIEFDNGSVLTVHQHKQPGTYKIRYKGSAAAAKAWHNLHNPKFVGFPKEKAITDIKADDLMKMFEKIFKTSKWNLNALYELRKEIYDMTVQVSPTK